MIGTALTLASLAASAFGASQSARQNREIDREIARRRGELQGWFDKEFSTSFLDTTSGKSAIKLLLENMRKQNEALQGSASIMGTSNEAVTAQKERFMENYTNAIAKMLGYDTERKDALQRQYLFGKEGIENLAMQNLQGKSQNWTNFMGNAANLGMSANISGAMGDQGGGRFGSYLSDIFGSRGGKVPAKSGVIKGLIKNW